MKPGKYFLDAVNSRPQLRAGICGALEKTSALDEHRPLAACESSTDVFSERERAPQMPALSRGQVHTVPEKTLAKPTKVWYAVG